MKKIIKSWRGLGLILAIFVLMGMSGKVQAFFSNGAASGANGQVAAIATQQDGKTIIGGSFTSYNGVERISVARLNVDGTLDESFHPVTGAGSFIRTIAIQSDGKILIGGIIYNSNVAYLSYGRRIARLNTDGSLDTSFTDPTATWSQDVRDIEIQTDGKIVIGGYFSRWQSSNGSTVRHLARLNSDGTLDTHFCNAVISSNLSNVVNTVALQPDGKILAGGMFQTYNGSLRNYLVRFNSDGTLDTTFNTKLTFEAGVYEISTLAIQTDGKIIAGGRYQIDDGSMRNYIARFNSDGSLDESFNADIASTNWIYWINSLAIQSDGKIIIGGNFQIYKNDNSNYRVNVARLNVDGTVDYGFGSEYGPNNDVRAVTIQPDGKILIGGNFTAYSGNETNYLAHLNNNGALDTTFNINVPAEESCSTLNLDANFNNYDSPIKENLVVITHGMNGSVDESWVAGARDDMCNKINRATTTIATYDWTYGAHTTKNAIQAYNNATPEGHYLAQKIKMFALNQLFSGKNFKSIHLIAHSAGSNVIQTAIDDLSDYYVNKTNKPFVHMTFLDAYVYDNAENRYGDLHGIFDGYSEQYVNMSTPLDGSSDLPFTNYKLTHATNFDVTDLPDSKRSHEWPYEFYRNSINDSSYKIGFVFAKENKDHYIERDDDFIGRMCKINNVYNDFNACSEIDGNKGEIILDDNSSGYSFETISIQEIKIDFSAFTENGTPLPQIELTSKLPSEEKLVSVSIPYGINITSDTSNWDNTITAPKETLVKDGWWPWADVKAIEVGFSGGRLSFDKAVRIEFPDRAGKDARYSRDGGESTEITRICSYDTQESGDSLPVDGECKINVGGSLVIWTKHFTIFATHSPDETAPEIIINAPVDGKQYVLNSTVVSDWSASDSLSGIDSAVGTVASGSPIDTSSIGSKSFSVTATDLAGNSVTETVSYDVIYDFGGFQNPIIEDGKTFNSKSTIPVTFQLTDAYGNYIPDAVASLIIDDGIEAVSSGSSNDGNKFRYDPINNQYVFNLSLKDISLESGAHTLKIVLGDGTIYGQSVVIK